MNRSLPVTALISALLLGGCVSLAPRYERPVAPVLQQWRNSSVAQRDQHTGIAAAAIADLDWKDFIQDERLTQVVALALENNRDLRVSMLNIEKSRAQYRIQRAELLPSISMGGSQSAARTPGSLSSTGESTVNRQYSADVGFSNFELDLFGRIRSLKDQALETYLATVETQRSARLSLISEVVGRWLNLVTDRQLLDLARQTLDSQRETLKLTEQRHAQGVVSGLDLAQLRAGVESARADVARYVSQVEQDRNALELVVGATVEEGLLPAHLPDTAIALAQIPAGLNSTVLLQRPDVLSAEHGLKAANANIGAARAAFFPSISLTTSTGRGSDQLSNLFDNANRSWSFIPRVSLPIFNAGSLRASLKVSEAERDIAVAEYEKAIQLAFREVADALSVRTNLSEQLEAQQALVEATSRSYALAEARYRNGVASYLDILDSQRSLYSARQALIGMQLTELSNRVALYKALGGGTATTATVAQR